MRCNVIMTLAPVVRWSIKPLLALDVHQLREHLVGSADDTRVGLEATLSGDHRRELGGEIHVRHLDRARGGDAPGTGGGRARGTDDLAARSGRGEPAVAGVALEAGLVRELRERDVAG